MSFFKYLRRHLRATATPKPGLARACAPDEPAKSAPPNGTLQRNALRRPRSRGGGPKQIRLRPCVHANSRQGLPIAVLSLFKGLAQETGLLWRPILSCSRTRASRAGGRRRLRTAAPDSGSPRSRATVFTHLKSPRGPLPQLAGEGGAKRRMGCGPQASAQVGLHNRHPKPASIHTCFPHPIRRYAAPSPLRGKGGPPAACRLDDLCECRSAFAGMTLRVAPRLR